jgi:hypothetical protein
MNARLLLALPFVVTLAGSADPALAQRPVFAAPSDSRLPLCRNVRGNTPCIGDETLIYPARDYQPPACVDGADGIPCGGAIIREGSEPAARWQRPPVGSPVRTEWRHLADPAGQRLDYFLMPPGETDAFVERSIAGDRALLGAPRDIDQPTLRDPDHYQVRYLSFGGPDPITIGYFWTPARAGGGLVCRYSHRARDLNQNRGLTGRCWPALDEAAKRARAGTNGAAPLPSPAN